jgi:hypothetical protein
VQAREGQAGRLQATAVHGLDLETGPARLQWAAPVRSSFADTGDTSFRCITQTIVISA